jgi:predicted ATPase
VTILCTNREALGAPGEAVHRLAPLGYPQATSFITAEAALAFPAVRLLVERTVSAMGEFQLTDRDAQAAVQICKNLDGMPLAIELAAPLVGAFGVAGIASRLNDHLRLLGVGRRNGTRRHRSIESALDWSYQLLDPVEQCVLRRLAIFAGGFTMEAAETILSAPGELIEVGAALASLSLKSLLVTDITGHDLRFRFLETTRAFALAKLNEGEESQRLGGRHARYFQLCVRRLRRNVSYVDIEEHLAELDNVRAALRFALGPGGAPIWRCLWRRECCPCGSPFP